MLTKSTFLLVLGVAMAMANMNNWENLQLLNVDFNDENGQGQLQFAEAGAIGQFQFLGYPCEEELNQNGVPIDGQCWVLVRTPSQPRPSQATHSSMG